MKDFIIELMFGLLLLLCMFAFSSAVIWITDISVGRYLLTLLLVAASLLACWIVDALVRAARLDRRGRKR